MLKRFIYLNLFILAFSCFAQMPVLTAASAHPVDCECDEYSYDDEGLDQTADADSDQEIDQDGDAESEVVAADDDSTNEAEFDDADDEEDVAELKAKAEKARQDEVQRSKNRKKVGTVLGGLGVCAAAGAAIFCIPDSSFNFNEDTKYAVRPVYRNNGRENCIVSTFQGRCSVCGDDTEVYRLRCNDIYCSDCLRQSILSDIKGNDYKFDHVYCGKCKQAGSGLAESVINRVFTPLELAQFATERDKKTANNAAGMAASDERRYGIFIRNYPGGCAAFCPQCRMPGVRMEACSHMTCIKCNHVFCMHCLAPVNRAHFCVMSAYFGFYTPNPLAPTTRSSYMLPGCLPYHHDYDVYAALAGYRTARNFANYLEAFVRHFSDLIGEGQVATASEIIRRITGRVIRWHTAKEPQPHLVID